MKNIITFSLLLIVSFSYSQKKYKRADDFFDKMWYVEAARIYEAVIEEGDLSPEAFQKAGDAYYFNTNMEGAYKWYDRLVSEYPDEVEAEYIFRYAHALEGIGEYKTAKKWMKIFSEKAKTEDPRSYKYSDSIMTVDDIIEIKPQFELKNLKINSKYSDFGPMYYKDMLVYATAIDSSYYHKRKYHWNEQPFLNLYLGRINSLQTDVSVVDEFSKEINTPYHEATLAFSLNEKRIYFTRNNYNGNLKRDGAGVNHLKLYCADIIDKKGGGKIWVNIRELPFNSDNYSVGHPTVSTDGKKLYFVSDMPGSMGATDIFVVDILEGDAYSEPRNLGPTINTYGREMFPYITASNLYFASDGHLGLGGLDVYQSSYTIDEGVFKIPVNLGAPLNSKLDDFGFIVKEEANTGFVCSNRESGKGDDDIYSFSRFELVCNQYIKGNIIDQKRKIPVEDVLVQLFDEQDNVINETKTAINGDFEFTEQYSCETPYRIVVSKEKYKGNENKFSTSDINEKTNEIILAIEKELNSLIVSVNGVLKINIDDIYFDLGKAYIRDDAAIELNKIVAIMQEYPEMVIKIESHTDSRGSDRYNKKLSGRRAASSKEFIISQGIPRENIESAIGYGETQIINNCSNGVKCANEEHDVNRRSEFIIVKM